MMDIRFQGVLVERNNTGGWKAQLVKDAHPGIAADELIVIHEQSDSISKTTTRLTAASQRIADELTTPFSQGELDADQFSATLKDILTQGDYEPITGSVRTMYSDPRSKAYADTTSPLQERTVASKLEDFAKDLTLRFRAEKGKVETAEETVEHSRHNWRGKKKVVYTGDSLSFELNGSLDGIQKRLMSELFEAQMSALEAIRKAEQTKRLRELDNLLSPLNDNPVIDTFLENIKNFMEEKGEATPADIVDLFQAEAEPGKLLKQLSAVTRQLKNLPPEMAELLTANPVVFSDKQREDVAKVRIIQHAHTCIVPDKLNTLLTQVPALNKFLAKLQKVILEKGSTPEHSDITNLFASEAQPKLLLKQLKIFTSQVKKSPELTELLGQTPVFGALKDAIGDLERYLRENPTHP